MGHALPYLLNRFGYRIYRFFYDWYVGGFLAVGGRAITILESMDQSWAFLITFRNLFKPLYQDESVLGRILGFFFRSGRLLIAGVLYLFVIVVGTALYAGWAAIPLFILIKGIR